MAASGGSGERARRGAPVATQPGPAPPLPTRSRRHRSASDASEKGRAPDLEGPRVQPPTVTAQTVRLTDTTEARTPELECLLAALLKEKEGGRLTPQLTADTKGVPQAKVGLCVF